MSVELGAEALASYERDGFLVIDRLVDDEDLDRLRGAYDDVLDQRVAARRDGWLGGITRQVMLPGQDDARFRENAALTAATDIAEQVFDGPVDFQFDMLIYKPPGHPHPTPWHQDMSYSVQPIAPAGTPIRLTAIQFWIALDDVDVENGCMHFIPQVHHGRLLEHRLAAGRPEDTQRLLEIVDPDRQLDLESAIAAPLRAGGATIHSYGTPHFTPPNRSADRPRRAYIFNLARRDGNTR